ncbi:MAG: methyl-accepting chemotaxis protein [Paraglaciecola sp.]|nr:methyl-accepting chemotaxis protein [Paraglaciecola sp.]NCT46948.1 methyl-accepting chemotaxis protein [Paraglaciecola sp.]
MKINDLSIRFKFAIPLFSITVMLILISIISLWSTSKLNQQIEDLSNSFLNAVDLTLNADRDLYQALTASQNYLLTKNRDQRSNSDDVASFNENAKQALDRMNKARGLMKDFPEIDQAIRSFDADYNRWLSSAKRVFVVADSGDLAAATNLLSAEVMNDFETLRGNYDVMGDKVREVADLINKQASDESASNQLMLILLIILALVVCCASVVFGPKLVTTRVFELNDVIKTISDGEGDLRSRLDDKGKDELATLATTFNGLMAKLQILIVAIKDDAATLNKTVTDLDSTSQQNQSISHNQSTNLHQISDALNQLGQAIHDIARSSQTAQTETEAVKQNTKLSTQVVDESVENINQLSKAISHAKEVIAKLAQESSQIVQVLDVIRSIADQTNLLALNAAIEAARAGEQGRGFAVVADEVRTLASRTQKSTEDIQTMIAGLEKGVDEAVNAITTGSSQVDGVVNMSKHLHDALNVVSVSVNNTSGIIFQIATATEQQSEVVDDINRTIVLLNGLSNESEQLAQQTNTVSANISKLAKGLNRNVGRFKV